MYIIKLNHHKNPKRIWEHNQTQLLTALLILL